ncbi:MAG TPA: ATP phosphoribosyltransferase [Pyrinomonadaceae bacterium]|nr:ATP phosphoribosyltransferase [Pyrinomonadaceae bacterium]
MILLTIAVAKGRLQEPVLKLLERAGIGFSPDSLSSRRLAIENDTGEYRFLFVKPADVPVYVEHGIADCGVVGRDVLLETTTDLLQPLMLGIGRCQVVVAGRTIAPVPNGGVLKVATKYPRLAAEHFGARGVPVEIITLAGSVELAPVLGLADCIVDLMETGETLRENGLVVVEAIAESSACLVVNRASFHLKADAVNKFTMLLNEQVLGEMTCSK